MPGRKESVTTVLGEYEARHFIREAYDHGKAIAASGERAELLQASGISTAPGVVIEQGRSNSGKSSIEAISQHRHGNRPKQRKTIRYE